MSSNPIGCKKINGGNNTATDGCGINTSIGTQPAFTTSPIRNASSVGPKNFAVLPPQPPPQNQRRHLLSTEILASPLASYTNVSGPGSHPLSDGSLHHACALDVSLSHVCSTGMTQVRALRPQVVCAPPACLCLLTHVSLSCMLLTLHRVAGHEAPCCGVIMYLPTLPSWLHGWHKAWQ